MEGNRPPSTNSRVFQVGVLRARRQPYTLLDTGSLVVGIVIDTISL